MNIILSALGRVETTGMPSEGDIIVGHSYGTTHEPGSANNMLGLYIAEYAEGRPIFVDRNLADALPEGIVADEIEEGEISTGTGGNTGTWGAWLHAREFMRQNGLETALVVAQRCHVGRVALQACKLGIPTVIPPGLPDVFDKHSDQWWTRSKTLWVPREVLGSFMLRKQGKL